MDDDIQRRRSDAEHDFISGSDVDTVRHNKPVLESDRPQKIRKAGVPDSSRKRKSDSCATTRAGEDETTRVEHGTWLVLSTNQHLTLDDIFPSQLPAEYEEAYVML